MMNKMKARLSVVPSPSSRIEPGNDLDKSRIDELRAKGLLPGQVDPERAARLLREDEARRRGDYLPPEVWDMGHVSYRLVEAMRTVLAMPVTVWPREFGTAWPSYTHDQADRNAQQEGGVLELRHSEQNRVRRIPSSIEIARMDEALAWPMQHLGHDDRIARCVVWGAMTKARRRDDEVWERLGLSKSTYYRFRTVGLTHIARALHRAKVPVT